MKRVTLPVVIVLVEAAFCPYASMAAASMAAASRAAASSRPIGTSKSSGVAYRLCTRGHPKGIANERDYAKWVENEISGLTRRSKSASDPISRVRLLLGLANFRLARQAEPALTRLALGDGSAEGLRRIATIATTARKEIARATEQLDHIRKTPAVGKGAAKDRKSLTKAAVRLGALAGAMHALGTGKDAATIAQGIESLTKTRGLGLLSSARLLKALLMRRAGLTEKALAELPPALDPPKQLPHGFFTRLLRCRLLADRGSFAIATALALRVDVHCDEWFDESRLPEAKAAVSLLRVELARRWADKLDGDKLAKHAAHRRSIADRISKGLAGDDVRVYRLVLAVPILVKPPTPPKPKTRPTTKAKPVLGSTPTTRTGSAGSRPAGTPPATQVAPPAGTRPTTQTALPPGARPATQASPSTGTHPAAQTPPVPGTRPTTTPTPRPTTRTQPASRLRSKPALPAGRPAGSPPSPAESR